MRVAWLLVMVLFITTGVQADDELWFDTGRDRYALNLRLGTYSDSGVLQHLGVRVPIADLDLALSHTRVSGDTVFQLGDREYRDNQSASRMYLATDPLATWTFQGGYEDGSTDFGEAYRNWVAGAGWNYHNGFVEVTLIAGEDRFDLILPLATVDPVIRSFSRNRFGAGIGGGWFKDKWAVLVRYRNYSLNADDPGTDRYRDGDLQSSLTDDWANNFQRDGIRRRLRGSTDNNTTVTSTSVSNGYQQVGSIVDSELEASLIREWQQLTVTLGFSVYEALFEEGYNNSLYLAADYGLTPSVDLGLLGSHASNSGSSYIELGFRIHWQ